MQPRIALITIMTSNAPAMVRFYRDVLGFAPQGEIDEANPGYTEFEHEGVRFAICARTVMTDMLGLAQYKEPASGQSFELAFPFDTTEATFDGEGQCMYSPNIWYCFTATVDGMVYVATCGSGYDTMLAVYDGCSCDPLPPLMECNDDSCGLQSEIMFPAIAGQEYLIEVGGYSTQSGPGVLTVMYQ